MPDVCQPTAVPLNSCSIIWANPLETLPRGRLQGHLRTHPTGGIVEVCPVDDCDDCGRGAAVCVRGEDPCTGLESPPACLDDDGADRFKNPLRRDVDGCLWVDVRRVFAGLVPARVVLPVSAGVAPASGGQDLASGTATFENPTCFAVKVKVDVCIGSALIGAPQPTGSGSVSVDDQGNISCSDIEDCRTPARVVYEVDVNGSVFDVFSSSGDWDHYSGTVCVGEFDVEPGGTLEQTVAVSLRYEADARDSFPYASGDVAVVFSPFYDIGEEDC